MEATLLDDLGRALGSLRAHGAIDRFLDPGERLCWRHLDIDGDEHLVRR